MHWSSDKSLRSQCVYMCVCVRDISRNLVLIVQVVNLT